MKRCALMLLSLALAAAAPERKFPISLHELAATTLEGKSQPMAAYKGQVLLVARDGRVLQAFTSQVAPDAPDLIKAIEAALAHP